MDKRIIDKFGLKEDISKFTTRKNGTRIQFTKQGQDHDEIKIVLHEKNQTLFIIIPDADLLNKKMTIDKIIGMLKGGIL